MLFSSVEAIVRGHQGGVNMGGQEALDSVSTYRPPSAWA
jgi:hypothetical protein